MADATIGIAIDGRQAQQGARTVRRGLDDVKQGAGEATGATQRLERQMGSLGGAARRLTQILGTLGIGLGFVSSVRLLADFGQTLSSVQAVTRATASQMAEMEATARRLGATTRFSAAQAAEGMRFLGMAGFEASEIISAMPSVLDLATAAALDLGRAADITSNIMSAFSVSAGETSRIADALATAAASANTDVGQMGDAMKFVGPVAATLGITMEDSAAAIATLSNVGIQASSAGTGLRRVLSGLSKPTSDAQKVVQSLGLTMAEVNPETNSLVDIIQKLADAGLNAEQALRIFGDRGGPAILALTSQVGNLEKLTAAINDAGGRAEEMARIMGDNLHGDILALISAFQELTLQSGDRGLVGALRAITQTATGVFRVFAGMSDPLDENLGLYKALAGAVTTLTGAFAAMIALRLAAWLKTAAAAMVTLNAAMVANPVGLVVAALGAAVGALIAFRNETVKVVGVTVNIGEILPAVWTTVSEAISGVVGWVYSLIQGLDRLTRLDFSGALESFNQSGRSLIDSGNAMVDAWRPVFGELQAVTETTEEAATATDKLTAAVNDAVDPTQNLAGANDDLKDSLESILGSLSPAYAATQDYREALETLQKAEAAGLITAKQRADLIDRLGKATHDARQPVAAVIEAYQQEIDLLKLSESEREIHTELLGVEADLRRELGRDLLPQERTELERLIRAKAGEKKAIEDAKAAQDKLNKERERQAEETERLLRQPFDNFIESTQRATADMFEDIFSGGVNSFGDLFQTVKRLGIRFAAEMAAMLVFRPSVVGGLGGMFGIGGTGGSQAAAGGGGFSLPNIPTGNLFGGGFGASIDAFGASLGFSPVSSSFVGPLTQAQAAAQSSAFTSATLSGTLGAAGLGFAGGSLLASITGGNSLYGGIGGGIGAGLGFMVGGPVGGVIGGAAGGLLGGMFGGGESIGPIGHTNIGVSGGRLVVGTTGVDNGAEAAATIQAAQQAVGALNAVAERFALTISGVSGLGGIGQGNPSGWGAGIVGSADEFVSRFVRGGGFASSDPILSSILRNSRAGGIEGLVSDLEFAEFFNAVVEAAPAMTQVEAAMRELAETFETASARAKSLGLSVSDLTEGFRTSFERDVADAIRAIEDPFGQALELQQRDAQARLDLAKQLGADLVDVERLNALERQKIVEQSLGDLRAWLDGQAITSGAITGTGRLAEAQSQFDDVLGAIRGGDRTQANLSRVTGLADTIIGLGAQLYGGTAQRAALEAMVRSQVESIGRLLDVPGFAAGGLHSGGWRIVGERGPELEFTGPSRIMSASQTRAAMGSGLTREDVRMLVRSNAEMAAELRAVRAANDETAGEMRTLRRDVSRVLTSQTQQRARKAG